MNFIILIFLVVACSDPCDNAVCKIVALVTMALVFVQKDS